MNMNNTPSESSKGDFAGPGGGEKNGVAVEHGNDVEVAPETPTMRSVGMMSSGPTLIAGGFPEGKTFGGINKPPPLRSFGGIGKPPKLGIARPSSVGTKMPLMQEVFEVKQEWSGSSTPSCWNVKGEDLDMVPWEFPLERTNREICEDASVVAKRISESLRALSVEAEYCSENAKAKCKTTDFVVFRIRLFAGGEHGQPVVVEMQRRSGPPSSFMKTCRAVLQAAEGMNMKDIMSKMGSRRPPFAAKPVGSLKCLASVIPKQQNFESEASSALEGVLDMLRSEQRDMNILGLENLCCLTDPLKTVPGVSIIVANGVILGGDKYDIREEIRLLTERDVFAPDFDKTEGLSTHSDHLRFLALCALANALGLCSKEGGLAAALKEQRWFADYLIPSLVDELNRVETCVNNSYKAASCLHSMIDCSPEICQTLVDNGSVATLEKAHQIGRERHELLANETQHCLKAVRGR